MTTTALSGPIDVHMVTHEQARQGRRRHLPAADGLTVGRQVAGLAVAAAGLPLATVLLASLRGQLSLPSDILTVMVVVVAAAILGGFWPGIAAAVAGFLLLNYYFTEPYHTFVISHPDDVLALTVFVVVAAAVSAVVGLAARRTRDAARAGADAEVLFNLAGNVLRGEHALDALLDPAARDLRAGIGHPARIPSRHPAHPRPPERSGELAGRRRAAANPAPPPAKATLTSTLARASRWCCAAGPARRRPAHPGSLRRPGGGRATPAAAGRGGRTHPPPSRSRPDAHRPAVGSQPRPSHPAQLRHGGRREPGQP